MQPERFLPPTSPTSDVEVIETVTDAQAVIITLRSTHSEGSCPRCAAVSRRIHSRYTRTVQDLPWGQTAVVLRLQLRRFHCHVPMCAQKTFVETVPTVVARSARRTVRLVEALHAVGYALGGTAGARLGLKLGLAASPATLLRILQRTPPPQRETPRVLGVDEWAWRKGQRYGTLLVDLERRRPVELLPDASADSLAAWLQVHPKVEIISRDRAGAFADGARQGAPQAVQVADRWHLIRNLAAALGKVLDRHAPLLATPAGTNQSIVSTIPVGAPASGAALRVETAQAAGRRQPRLARYEQVCALHQQGLSLSAIAAQLQLDRRTVSRFAPAPAFPERKGRRPQPSLLDQYLPYLLQRWNGGCYNGTQLWRAVQGQGFPGGRSVVARWVARLRRLAGMAPRARSGPATRVAKPPRWSARHLTWLVLRRPEALTEGEQRTLRQLTESGPVLQTAGPLAQAFVAMVRARDPSAFDRWLAAAKASEVPELRSVAARFQRDHAAVEAALSLPWSTGPVEGHIHRLKLIKRQGYGRAGFELLRRRVLDAA